ncbi:MAG TPA: AbrB/MazE/SpoVT family DNA-binding domain-containing protein [Chloroflexota bacterium]|nr:AbrB/MazE/SpoVT family DNA-binding domain-containing protein [Chloroflexota bacterium]
MKATIDGAGRIVIPKEIRRQARLGAGAEVDVRWRDGLIEIEPARQAVRLVRDGPLLVAVADGDTAPLTTEQVEEIRDALRRERSDLA